MNTSLHHLFLFAGLAEPLGAWAYIFIALLVAVEGPLTTLAGAVAASAGFLNPILVFVSAATGNLTADVLWYSLGYLGKTDSLRRYGSWFGIKEKLVLRLEKDLHTHIRKILFIAKLTLGFVVPTLIAAGLARVPFKRWFGVLFAAECLWTGSLVIAGYHFGRLIQNIEMNLRWVSLAGSAIFLILLFIYLARRRAEEMENE